MKQEIAGGAALLALAVAYLIGASGIPHSTLSDEVGARGLPYVLGVLLAFVAVGIMARAAVAGPRVAAVEGNEETKGSGVARALGFLVIAAVYCGVAAIAGYIIACAITLLVVMVYEGAALNLRNAAIAASGAVFFWLAFVYVLGVQQPVGRLLGG